MPSILELSPQEAKAYFLEPKNYVNFDLPPYFDFSEVLTNTANHVGSKGIHEFFETTIDDESTTKHSPKDYEGVNYNLISNKDGEFAWRPYEIIHPLLYVGLVNDITQPKYWAQLKDRFATFSNISVYCASIPIKSDDDEKHKAHQVKQWWTDVEQGSLKMGLKFQYTFDVDIADCYGSIYTHSLAWAIEGKEKAKKERRNYDLLGNRVDLSIQKMRHGQTNGIPQGSTLMDFIAEILLGYVDSQLSAKLSDLDIFRKEYSIIRFRDDYRIFVNNPESGRIIVKELSSILSSLGMKLNTSKTKLNSDPIIASIKEDKLYELLVPNNKISLSKKLLQIYECANIYPNSGLVTRKLNEFFKHIEKSKSLNSYDDAEVMISIVTNLAIKNPRSYQWSMAILSQLLDYCDKERRMLLIDMIRVKFEAVSNSGLLEIWLQRISYKLDPSIDYDETLARIASGTYLTNIIWKSGWVEPSLRNLISDTPIVKRTVLEAMPIVIPQTEVALFSFPRFS